MRFGASHLLLFRPRPLVHLRAMDRLGSRVLAAYWMIGGHLTRNGGCIMNNQPLPRRLAERMQKATRWFTGAIDAFLTPLARREDGANLVIVAALMTAMIGFAGLAIDGSNLYYQNQRMQIAADAAALGGARQLAISANDGAVNAEIQHLGLANAADTVTWSYINSNRGVHVIATRTFDAYFARIFGYSHFTARGEAEAQYEPVTGVDNLFPLTMDCDCVDESYVTPGGGDGGGGDEGDSTPDDTPGPDDDEDSPTTGTINLPDDKSSSYAISFVGRTDNTWTYQVDEISGRDLSHWLLNIESCLDDIVTSSPGGSEIGVDGSTGEPGIKWNVDDGFSSGQFSFTLNDDFPAGQVEALAKAGTEFGTVSIRGPICDGTNVGTGTGTGGTGTANICLPTIDFETDSAGAALSTGQIINNEWGAWGVHVTSSSGSHPPMIFNTASPTGGDADLGSPNEDFGGPGEGNGGRSGQPGQNNTPQGKVLIVAEHDNSADPDDNAGGGSLIFTFDYPVRVDEVRILDVDDVNAAGVVKAYSDSGGNTLVATGRMLGLGDNSLQTVGVNARDVRRLEVVFPESGSMATLVSCRNQAISTYALGNLIWSDLDSDGVQDDGEPGIPGVVVELYGESGSSVIARTTTNAGGVYRFENLPDGNYEVKIAESNFAGGGPLDGAIYVTQDVGQGGGDVATDSDFNGGTGRALATIASADNDMVDGGFIVPTGDAPSAAGPQSGVVELNDNKDSRYEISLESHVGTTWTYRVREVAGRDLSHWDLGIESCLDHIVAHSPSSGYESGTDGSTGFVGIKWNVDDGFSNGTFSFTLDDDYSVSTVKALAKAGNEAAQIDIVGPDCSELNTDDEEDDSDDEDDGDTPDDEDSDDEACSFGWLDWNGTASSYMELANDMNDTGRSGVWRLGEVIPPGPDVAPNSSIESALDSRVGSTVKIPLTQFNGSGYAICGFAQVELIDYSLDLDDNWLSLQFLKALLHGVETDPTEIDFGVRDVRFVR